MKTLGDRLCSGRGKCLREDRRRYHWDGRGKVVVRQVRGDRGGRRRVDRDGMGCGSRGRNGHNCTMDRGAVTGEANPLTLST